jgi:hypothetical protein
MRDSLSSIKDKILDRKRQEQNIKKRNDISSQIHELMEEIDQENIEKVKAKYEQKIKMLLDSIKNDRVKYNRKLKYLQSSNSLPVVRSHSASKPASIDKFILNDLSIESLHKYSSSINPLTNNDREMSIREIQFQEKFDEIKRLENLSDSIIGDVDKKKYVVFQEVLVRPKNRHLHHSLSKYNRGENLSVERIARTRSPFKLHNFNRPPLPRNPVRRFKNKPSIDLGPG